MKKIIKLTLSVILLFSTAGCGATSEKYPYDHIGIYDTKTQQYIDIGDSKEKVEKILGRSFKQNYDFVDYGDILSIRYDDNNNVDNIRIFFDWFPEEGENERYTLADGTDYNTTITEFINKYERVYDGALSVPDSAVSIVLQNNNGKIILPDVDDIKESVTSPQENIGDIYVISIDYAAYDNLSSFEIEKVSYPAFEKWENFKIIEK